MSRATWSKEDTEWLATHPHGLPPEPFPYVHSSQRWRQPGPKTPSKGVDPWNSRTWKARHPGMSASRRALRWLEVTFGR